MKKVAKMGLDKWLVQQLKGNLSAAELDKRLEAYSAPEPFVVPYHLVGCFQF